MTSSMPQHCAQLVAECLAANTYEWSTERELQDLLEPVLRAEFPTVEREPRLSLRDRPDFLVDVVGTWASRRGCIVETIRVAVEVKTVKAGRNAVVRQLGRYAEHDGVDAIVLASGMRALLAGIPERIHGKPIAVALVAGVL